jgi:hypothetical protein
MNPKNGIGLAKKQAHDVGKPPGDADYWWLVVASLQTTDG